MTDNQQQPSQNQAANSDAASGKQQQGQDFAMGSQSDNDAGEDRTARLASQITEHMEVIGADGAHVGTVDEVDGDRIKLTKSDSGVGAHAGHHHYLSLSQVSDIEGNQVRLSSSGANAYASEDEM